MENPAPEAEGEDPGAGEAQDPQPDSGNRVPWMNWIKTPSSRKPICENK